MRHSALLAIAAGLLLASACKEEAKSPATVVARPAAATETTGAEAKASPTSAPAVPGPKGPTMDCDRAKLATAALTKGKKVFAGITMKTSLTQAELFAGSALYTGKKVRVEGPVVAVCKPQGCWASLEGPSGRRINLKVTDGVVDFRKLAKNGQYIVGEGVFEPTGHHGAQVKITGAMIAEESCVVAKN